MQSDPDPFEIPLSYAAYDAKKDVRTAVDHILDVESLEVPCDLRWDQLPDFYTAVLAAQQVRCDYATSLHRLWNETWQEALDSSGTQYECLLVTEAKKIFSYDVSYDPCTVWENSLIYRYVRMSGLVIELGVSLNSEAVLWLWVGDENVNENIDALEAMIDVTDWVPEPEIDDETYFGRTKKGIAKIKYNEQERMGEIELGPLIAAAKGALEKLAEWTGKDST